MKLQGDFDALMQGVNTYGDKKRRSSQRRRLKVFADDIRTRAAVGDDGIHHPDGLRLKPREVDWLIKNTSKGEATVKDEQMRTSHKRMNDHSPILGEGYIEVPTSVSIVDSLIKELFSTTQGKL